MEQADSPPTGTLSAALAAAAELLGTNPAAAEKRASNILKTVPGQHQALLLLVSARLAQGDMAGARAMLELSARAQPKLAAVQYELGLLLGDLDEHDAAIAVLSRVVELEPEHPAAWRALGDQLAETGQAAAAGKAYARHFQSSVNDLKFLENAASLAREQPTVAEGMLNAFLDIHPTDLSAIHMLAQICLHQERFGEAERLFLRALDAAPRFQRARQDYIHLLTGRENPAEANRQLEIILQEDPHHLNNRALKAAALLLTGNYREANADYEALIADHPQDARLWISYAYALRTGGQQNDAIMAYRRGIALRPGAGEAWWGLANLKTFRFSSADVETMRAQLDRDDLPDEDRIGIHFALGKALEDEHDYADSFENYRLGNLLRRAGIHYNPDDMGDLVRRSKTLYTQDFFRNRSGFGCPTPDPIFIVGLPRSGSTLIEQILSSHSAVEGTSELPELISISIRLGAEKGQSAESTYLEVLPSLVAENFRGLGEKYLERTRVHRKLAKPRFTDKMPNNFHHLGLIQLILPNAKIVDVRRHPLACCFSNFKQHFSSGIGPTYDLGDLGRYYRDYLELMAHFDAVLPGRVHRVIYEDMVRDPETEIRRLLDYCGLPFEEACLRFHETERGVLTASSEQVRQPIFDHGMEQWRHYEQWLGPLRAALGPALDAYAPVPRA
jgi:predicted Zn-dependent protease